MKGVLRVVGAVCRQVLPIARQAEAALLVIEPTERWSKDMG